MPEDFERFESPKYSDEEIEFEDNGISTVTEKIGPGIEIIKKNARIIAVVAVIAIIALFAYNFFIGSVREITIVVKDTEGKAITGNRLKLFDYSKNEIATLSGESSYSVQLKVGSYRYEISSDKYATKRGTFVVKENGQVERITLAKNIGIEIQDFESAFPKQWIAGQTRTIEFNVKNNESTAKEIEIVF